MKRDKAPKADPTAAAMTELRKIAESAVKATATRQRRAAVAAATGTAT
jgi:hypothetical protein